MTVIEGARFQPFGLPGSMGVVVNTRYVRCFWPKLDRPTALFAAGSSGIEVEGPPTPRNVVFPPGTVFLNGTRGDCFLLRQRVELRRVVRPGLPDRVEYDEYVAELTAAETADLVSRKLTEASLREGREFVHISHEKPSIVGVR